MKNYPILLLFSAAILLHSFANAQPITGFWKGKIDRKNVELKIIKNGDSLTGTSYYYESANSYRRYSIKGYFDDRDNSVVWWDDQLIEAKNSNRLFGVKPATPYLSTADFNCPGGTKMYLDGRAALKDKAEQERGPVDLQKMNAHTFNDEWDFVIDNYTFGANDPELIDSIGKLVFTKPVPIAPTEVEQKQQKASSKDVAIQPKKQVIIPATKIEPAIKSKPAPVKEQVVIIAPLSNEQKFATRRKLVLQEIPISGDSIELRFYDNAEVDGDSIAIFLNNQLLYEHVRLSEKAYTIRLAVATLQQSNELVMVAENLGSIPPNTSLMVAMVGEKRYETRLESTEQSSAVIRFIRKEP
ncbi:MAG: hypothetical protein ABIN67_25025 [Ferruginibacter sp.]